MAITMRIRLEPARPYEWYAHKPDSKSVERVFNNFTNAHGQAVAGAAAGRMSDMLRRSHKFEIGATEASANNIMVQAGKKSGPFTTWEVAEGGATPANEIIKQGFGPQTVKIETLYKWAINKKLQLREMGEDTQARKIRYTKSRMDDPRHRDRPSHAYRKGTRGSRITDEQIVLGALYRIRSAIKKSGSKRAPTSQTRGANWFPRYPAGQGRFDYVTYVTKMDGTFNSAMRDANKLTENAVVEFLRTGRSGMPKFGNTRYYTRMVSRSGDG